MKKIRVGAVNYLNTKPLLYGLRHHAIAGELEIVEDYPANIANQLIEGKLDVGLIPVAATLRMPAWHFAADYCIACDGAVASVCLFSDVPMAEIETVLLDYQSRTSVNLARILLRDYWKKAVRLIDATGEDYRNQISGTTAGVVIGDRALEQRLRNPFIYDLGEAWKAYTGLPFVFAAWISRTPVTATFKQAFNTANQLGLEGLETVISQHPSATYDLRRYFTQNIQYNLTAEKKKGLWLFLEKLQALQAEPTGRY